MSRCLFACLLAVMILSLCSCRDIFSASSSGTSVPRISAMKLHEEMAKRYSFAIIDIRPSPAYVNGHIRGAINITEENVQSKMDEIPKDKDIIVVDDNGNRSAKVAAGLKEKGYPVYGYCLMDEWASQRYEMEIGPGK